MGGQKNGVHYATTILPILRYTRLWYIISKLYTGPALKLLEIVIVVYHNFLSEPHRFRYCKLEAYVNNSIEFEFMLVQMITYDSRQQHFNHKKWTKHKWVKICNVSICEFGICGSFLKELGKTYINSLHCNASISIMIKKEVACPVGGCPLRDYIRHDHRPAQKNMKLVT